jgi:hypothetical protein
VGLNKGLSVHPVKCRGVLLLVLEVDWLKKGRTSPDWFS